MAGKPRGDRALTGAEREARRRDKRRAEVEAMKAELARLKAVQTEQIEQPAARDAPPPPEATAGVRIRGHGMIDLGDIHAPFGSPAWCKATHTETWTEKKNARLAILGLRVNLKSLKHADRFRTLKDADGRPFTMWGDYVQYPEPHGLGMRLDVAEALMAEVETNRLLDHVAAPTAPQAPVPHDAWFRECVSREVERHINEYLMPHYKEKLEKAELLTRIGKPFTNTEFRDLMRALHPDSSNPDNRLSAFQLVKQKEVVLRPEEKDKPLSGRLPKSLGELMARRKKARAQEKGAPAKR